MSCFVYRYKGFAIKVAPYDNFYEPINVTDVKVYLWRGPFRQEFGDGTWTFTLTEGFNPAEFAMSEVDRGIAANLLREIRVYELFNNLNKMMRTAYYGMPSLVDGLLCNVLVLDEIRAWNAGIPDDFLLLKSLATADNLSVAAYVESMNVKISDCRHMIVYMVDLKKELAALLKDAKFDEAMKLVAREIDHSKKG